MTAVFSINFIYFYLSRAVHLTYQKQPKLLIFMLFIFDYDLQYFIMSIFKLKPLWSTVFSQQQFDQKHLAVGKIGRQAVVAVGSYQGNLRVFMINKNREIEIRNIYENKFDSGIIDVKFVAHPDQRIRHGTIGILFFRKFAYLSFENTSEGNYESKIIFVDVDPAFGIGISPISVMTLNSTIQYLNPLQVQKLKVADPIYPYTRSLNKIYFVDGEELVEIQGSTEQWRIIVGRVRQLFVFVDTIVVIGEKALWEVENAKIIKTKVMEQQISCGTIAFRSVSSYNIIVANFSGQLFVYSSNYELLWALKLEYVALRIIVLQHEQIKGMLAILSEQGNLELAYSGVEIPDGVVEPLSEKIDYDVVQIQTQQYLDRMHNKVEEKSNQREIVQNKEAAYKLYFKDVEKSYQNLDEKDRLFQIQGKLIKCQFVCQITSTETLRNFKIQINLPFNLYCSQFNQEFNVAKNGQKIIFTLFANKQSFPYQRDLSVIVRYQNNDQRGPPFIKIDNVPIPIGLQCSVTGFQSNATLINKIVVKSNLEMPSFNDIFPELFGDNTTEQRKTIKFTLANGVDCVVTYNKGYNKAKIQSQYYSGLCFIVNQFSHHIRKYNANKTTKIELSVQIPLQEFFTIMKEHYEHRALLRKAFADVQIKSQEFRSTQKKLLIKMKEKMNNMGSIDKLLEYTYDRLMDSATHYEQVNHEMDIINHNLCVAIKLIIELLFIRANPSLKAKNIAIGILGYEKQSLQRSWEDKVVANSSYFLNKKYTSSDQISFEQLQKIPLYVISKVNSGDWN